MNAPAVQIYRELSPGSSQSLLDWLDARQQLYNVVDNHNKERIYIDNDLPRNSDITDELITSTVGFALFSTDGDYIGSYRSLDRAIDAASNAKISVVADVDVEPDPEDEDEGSDPVPTFEPVPAEPAFD